MPSRKAVQQLRRKLEQQNKQDDALRRTTEELYLLVYRIHKDEGVSTYGIATALGLKSRTVQGWLNKGEKLAAEE